MKKLLLVLAVCSSSVFAINPWAECGIGGAIGSLFPKKIAGKVAAIITNIAWDLGTTATSSAVSSPDLCANREADAAKLIHDTYEGLIAETAIGKGQNLTALLDIIEVKQENRSEFIKALRAEISQYMSDPEYTPLSRTDKAKVYYYSLFTVVHKNS